MTSRRVLVTGGGGYVGSLLVPRLLADGHFVRVIDWFVYGHHVLDAARGRPSLELVEGDIRDWKLLDASLDGIDTVIHLACISNDPSFDLDPSLGRSVNFEAFTPLAELAKAKKVARFVFASSASVYGVSEAANVDEDHPLKPLTDYSRYKAECEKIILGEQARDFVVVIVRPATLCGYAPRLRLDLVVNILTNHAVNRGRITVTGGPQKRPNLHVDDMVRLYSLLLTLPDDRIAGRIYNVSRENHTVAALAELVRTTVEAKTGKSISIETKPTDDLRSYHISAERIARELEFVPRRSIADGIADLTDALTDGRVPNALDDPRYFNIRTMKEIFPIRG